MGTAQGIIDVARSYLGTTEDDPRFFELIAYYNEHTGGYDMRTWDEWCACFVSVCSLKSANDGATGTSVNCATFRGIWKDKGIYRDPWVTPAAGWLIDYDWDYDGIPDHIGIVAGCDGSMIHVIEGNMNEVCGERWIPVGWPFINCFAAPAYDGIEKGEKVQYIDNYGGPVYRLRNPNGFHYWTKKESERANLRAKGWIDEGIAFETRRGGSDAIYLLYNPNNGDHLYTPDFEEAKSCQEAGWEWQGVPFFAWADGTPVYRLYNHWTGEHFYTDSEKERNDLIAKGWRYEEKKSFTV